MVPDHQEACDEAACLHGRGMTPHLHSARAILSIDTNTNTTVDTWPKRGCARMK